MTKINSKTIKKHKKILKYNKSFIGSNSKLFKIGNQKNIKSLSYSYINRKIKKRNFKKLWNKKINNITKNTSLKNYNTLTYNLKINNILINRKTLSKLLEKDPEIIKKII